MSIMTRAVWGGEMMIVGAESVLLGSGIGVVEIEREE
jgi:hypothetical protein